MKRQFKTSYWNNEALVCLPKPASAACCDILPLLNLGGFRIELEILRSATWSTSSDCVDALKVLFGAVHVDGEESPRAALSVPSYTSQSAATSKQPFRSLEQGAIVIRLCRILPAEYAWSDVGRIPIKPLLKVSPENGPQPEFRFTRVTKGKDFWNLKGFEIRFADQIPLAHVQFWTSGMAQIVSISAEFKLIHRQAQRLTAASTITAMRSSGSFTFHCLLVLGTEVCGGYRGVPP